MALTCRNSRRMDGAEQFAGALLSAGSRTVQRWFILAFILALCSGPATGANLVLKIRAINPSQSEKQSVEVKSLLPRPATPEDILDAGGLDVVYDVAGKTYSVKKTVELNPGETRTFEIQLKDIWVIAPDRLEELERHGAALAGALKGTAQGDTAARVGDLVDEGLKGVRARQTAHAVGASRPVDHIRAYEANVEALDRIRRDIGMLENLAIAAGKDPGQILGAARVPPPVEAVRGETPTGQTAVIHIKITNTSLTEKRKVPIRRELPPEVKPTDVMETGGLQISFDSGRNVTFAYDDGVELAPQETKTFLVKIRNPWAATGEWLPRLETRARELSDICRKTDAYKSVVEDVEKLLKDIETIKGAKGPETMSEAYVAFARNQVAQIRDVEGRVMRLEELFQPREKPQQVFGAPMLNVKPPSRRTTWIIIYIILGFLGLVSLMFYLRWYGKSKAEKVGPAGGNETGGSSP